VAQSAAGRLPCLLCCGALAEWARGPPSAKGTGALHWLPPTDSWAVLAHSMQQQLHAHLSQTPAPLPRRCSRRPGIPSPTSSCPSGPSSACSSAPAR